MLTPEEDFSDAVIRHMTPRYGKPETNFLDFVTKSIVEQATFDKRQDIKYIGVSGMLFPQHYSYLKRNSEDNKPYPFLHRTEFIVTNLNQAKIKVRFCYLRPVIRGLRERNNGKWTALGSSPRTIDGVPHSSGNEEPAKQILELGEFEISNLMKEKFSKRLAFMEGRNEYDIDPNYKYVYTQPENSILAEISCRHLEPDKAVITVQITNTSSIDTSLINSFSSNDVAKKSFYGSHTVIDVSNCDVEDMLSEDSGTHCNNVNTFPVISKENVHKVFSSPLVVHDSPSCSPIKLHLSFNEITKSKENLKDSLYLLSDEQKKYLETSSKVEKILKIVTALGKSLDGKVTHLHKFQWDAIQTFIGKIVDKNSTPMVIRAPTGSGKSLVFYTCCVLLKELSNDVRGTIAFVTFPTRALNTQQFGEMIEFFFHLNEEGIKISLGMYMGKKTEGAVKTLDPSICNAGDAILAMDHCPACGNHNIVISKPNPNRIVPKCANTKCGAEFPFIFLSNRETEKFCPNVIVGTPDKLINSLSHNVYSHPIFGAPCKKCPNCESCMPSCTKHQSEATVPCDVCKTELTEKDNFQSTPCFVVFDEIHTLSGTQGNLFSHFLSLMKVLNRTYGNPETFWYLGATATIANQGELLYNLTGYQSRDLMVFPSEVEYSAKNGKGYFETNSDLKHRYVILESLTVSTRGSISRSANNISDRIQVANKSESEIIKNLTCAGIDVQKSFGTQTIYVLRKDDGRDIEKYIPEDAQANNIRKPRILFGSGDLSSEEISQLNNKVRTNQLDILVVTQIYGQGVDFPGLNILHFFGTPRRFIEFHQVVGRTGRSRVPGIVIVHPSPSIPRDEWVYQNFRKMINDINGHYEPTPINYANKYAISLSIPNIIHTLLIANAYQDHNMRFSNYVYDRLRSDKPLVDKILSQAVSVYVRNETRDSDKDEIRREIGKKLLEILYEFGKYKMPIKEVLEQKNILVGTLRRPSTKVPYSNMTPATILGGLKTSRSEP